MKRKVIKLSVHHCAGMDHYEVINPPQPMMEFFSIENAVGKTSMRKALENMVAGGSPQPFSIRDGEDEASAELHFEDAQIKVSIKRETGRTISVKVMDEKTGKLRALPSGQQTWLNKFIGPMVNPAFFAEMDAKDQLKLIQSLADPEWLEKRSQFAAEIKKAEAASTLAGQMVKAFGEVQAADPVEEVKVGELASELSRREAANRESAAALETWRRETAAAKKEWERSEKEKLETWQRDAKAAREAWERSERETLDAWNRIQAGRALRINAAEMEVARARGVVEKLRRELAESEAYLASAESNLATLPAPETQSPAPTPEPDAEATRPVPVPAPEPGTPPEVVNLDTEALRQSIAAAEETNKKAALYQRHLERIEERKKLVAAHEAAKQALAHIREESLKHDKSATLPEGLSIGPDGAPTFAGRPMCRMSTGEGVVLAFAIMKHRGQGFGLLDNAEAIGPANIKKIRETCEETGMIVALFTRGTPHTEGAYELRDVRVEEVEP